MAKLRNSGAPGNWLSRPFPEFLSSGLGLSAELEALGLWKCWHPAMLAGGWVGGRLGFDGDRLAGQWANGQLALRKNKKIGGQLQRLKHGLRGCRGL
jgi:hypothetical protein